MKCIEVEVEQVPLHRHPKNEQDYSPAKQLQQHAALRMAELGAAGEAEGHRGADDEQEERHDQVIGSKTFPAGVFELMFCLGDPGGIGLRNHCKYGEGKFVSADDPKHIEPAEGIERENAGGRNV